MFIINIRLMIKVQKGGHEYQVKGMLYKIRKEELWPNLFNFFFFKKDNICWKLRLNFEEDNFRIDFNIFCFYVGQEAGCCSWCCERAREFNILSILRLNPRAPYTRTLLDRPLYNSMRTNTRAKWSSLQAQVLPQK